MEGPNKCFCVNEGFRTFANIMAYTAAKVTVEKQRDLLMRPKSDLLAVGFHTCGEAVAPCPVASVSIDPLS